MGSALPKVRKPEYLSELFREIAQQVADHAEEGDPPDLEIVAGLLEDAWSRPELRRLLTLALADFIVCSLSGAPPDPFSGWDPLALEP